MEQDGAASAGCGAACPNCGSRLSFEGVAEATGDHILVNKSVFLFRRPRRWEIVVFRLFGKVFVKRVIGLPGEWIVIEDGDVYIDELLARKTLDELKQVRVLVFDNNFRPASAGWTRRWQTEEPRHASLRRHGELFLAGSDAAEAYIWLTYRNFSLDGGKVQPLVDEYAYNAGSPGSGETVHDFMLECDLEVESGHGQVGLGITDGQDLLLVEAPVTPEGITRLLQADGALPSGDVAAKPLAKTSFRLLPGRTYHLELAFVDRRLTLAADGEEIFIVDLPPARNRRPVTHPVSLGVHGVDAIFRNVRLYRDLHYTQAGRHAVAGKAVHLAPDQYFVLGDNSPNSEDSRFWAGDGAVPEANLVGKPFLVHLPSRVVSVRRFGHHWQYQLPDWNRIRWLH
jgi:signal peptidase I